MKSAIGRALPFLTALLVVLADRISKMYIQRAITYFDAISVVPGWLRIVHTENPGAAFGMLAEGSPVLRSAVLIGVSSCVLLLVVYALLSRNASFISAITRLGLSFILGGAMGNMIDRVFRGTVTDFIEVYHGTWSFPAFNVADSAITIGACLLLLDLIRAQRRGDQEHVELVHK